MLVAVGGHSRNIGKTSVVAGLIAALPEWNWTAVKITQYGNDVCSSDGEPCECAPVDYEHPYAISEELDVTTGTDTSRFLAAGAARSYWLRTPAGQLGNAMPAIRRIIDTNQHVIFESNSILQFLKPNLYLIVLDFATKDFKPSTLTHMDRADAVIVLQSDRKGPQWSGVASRLWESKPRFEVRPPHYVTAAIAAFARGRLNSSTTPLGETVKSVPS
jgi:hypothetical protein